MMKKIIITYLVLALMGCSASNDEMDFGTEVTGTTIEFATGMAPTITTRGPVIPNNNGLVEQDVAGVQILRDDNPVAFASGIPASATEATIKAINENNKNPMSLSKAQYFKVDRSDATFMAYYPAGSLSSGGVVKYTINGTQDILTSNQDIAKFTTKREVNFAFNHQLTCVRLLVTAENDSEAAAFGNLTKATIDDIPINLDLSIDNSAFKLEVDPASVESDLSFLSNSQPVPIQGGTNEVGYLMVYPQTVSTVTMEFANRPAETFMLNWDSSPNLLKAGMINTITMELKAFEIEFKASVAPWELGNEGGEEISIGGS